MIIGNRVYPSGKHCYIMGILNVTPDSFSDGGRYDRLDLAVRHAEKMAEDGADVIDIGGESTRPGYLKVTEEEEIARVVPVIRAVRERLDLPVSIDTYKSAVAKAALDAGADLVNDIWGFRADPEIARVTAGAGASCCLMHNRDQAVYECFEKDVLEDLKTSIRLAVEAGIGNDRILIDPGVGFGKTLEQNLWITAHVDILQELGFPVLLGTSRKSMIGKTLDIPVEERLEGTLATTVLAVLRGCLFVRVHDVKENKRVIDMTEALISASLRN